MQSLSLTQRVSQLTNYELIDYIQHSKQTHNVYYTELFMRHYSSLKKYLLYKTSQSEHIEDIIQETFIRCFRFIHQFKQEADFKTWLFRIAENQAYSLLKKENAYVVDEQINALIDLYHEDDLMDSVADSFNVHEMIKQLPDPSKDIIYLRFFLDMSLQEASHFLGITLSAAKMRLYRALDTLKLELTDTQAYTISS